MYACLCVCVIGVRDTAFAALTETYRYIGSKIWKWIDKENSGHSHVVQHLQKVSIRVFLCDDNVN